MPRLNKPSASRNQDRFDSPAKQKSRLTNLQVVQASPFLYDVEDRKLLCDWCELAGETAGLTIKMLEDAQVMGDRSYIGVDLDRDRMARFRKELPQHKWYGGDLRSLISELQRHEVGVLNIDGYDQVEARGTLNMFTLVRPLIEQGVERFGGFVLFSNNTLNTHRRGLKAGTALRLQVDQFVERLDGYARGRRLQPDLLLPPEAEKTINDGHFLGSIGAFEIYKGHKRGVRMANMRVVL